MLTRSLADVASRIVERRGAKREGGAALVAISGIDAAGKGTIAAELGVLLRAEGLAVSVIGLDAWLTGTQVGSPGLETGEQFYRHGFRFNEMFEGHVDPLRRDRSVDVILLEGIFLFKRELRGRYDLAIWVDCPVELALERALARNQEGLSRERLIADYRQVYFPAQDVHRAVDAPREFAEVVLVNR